MTRNLSRNIETNDSFQSIFNIKEGETPIHANSSSLLKTMKSIPMRSSQNHKIPYFKVK